jgi:predicted SAM-dependent methyltransferase
MISEVVILDIGCGDKRAHSNSLTLDVRKTSQVDIIADARALPFMDGSIDHLFSSHVIEHFSHLEVEDVVEEWIRVLKTGGTIEIRCPDLRARALLYFINPSRKNIQNIYGEQNYPANYHKCGFSYTGLKELLSKYGIKKIRRVYDGAYGIPFIPCDLHVKGVKDGKIS